MLKINIFSTFFRLFNNFIVLLPWDVLYTLK